MSLDIPQLGKAAVLSGTYGEPYRFKDIRVQKPGPDEALVRLDFSGVCHGDVYSRDGGGPAPLTPVRPLIGGHEGIGEIVALGQTLNGNKKTHFQVGDVVGIAWRSAVCGKCDACVAGWENFCEKQVVTGMRRDGTYQSTSFIFSFGSREYFQADFTL